jgi:WD40 repeat protein
MNLGIAVSTAVAIWIMEPFAATVVQAGALSDDPILRIETGMHSANINRMATDERNLVLATVSDDKTVRIWDLPTLAPVKTIRVPIGKGKEGKLYAVALRPDGRVVVCGGQTAYGGAATSIILIIDVQTGSVLRAIHTLPSAVLHLTYSKDGRHVVAAFGHHGIRVYDAATYSLVAEDKDYAGPSYGAEFSPSGTLATTSYDGLVRLYDTTFTLRAKAASDLGKHPYGVKFSPDGSRIAVGFEDSAGIIVLSGKDLSLLAAHRPAQMKGALANVVWDAGGNTVYAGGIYDRHGVNQFIKWDTHQGAIKEIPTTSHTVTDIVPLQPDGMVFSTSKPSIGIVGASDRVLTSKDSPLWDFRGIAEQTILSDDGTIIHFPNPQGGFYRFSILDRSLETHGHVSHAAPRLPPIAADLVSQKLKTAVESLKEQIKHDHSEIVRATELTPDGKAILVGSDWHLRLLEQTGHVKWKVSVPAPALVIKISAASRLAVAALADGTFRWYRLADGQEILALFLQKEKNKWVLWTPAGYYDAAPGAEELMGWHRNNGPEQAADFFPIGKWRSTYYRPDIIPNLFTPHEGHNGHGRLPSTTSVTDSLPPVVNIMSPLDGSEIASSEATVQFALRPLSDEPITAVKTLVDGRPAMAQRGIQVKSAHTVRTVRVPIPEKDVQITLIAENRFGSSEPATIRLRWKGPPKAEEFVIRPKLYILAVGISAYRDSDLSLQLPAKDAQDFVQTLIRQKEKLYRDVVPRILLNERATKEELLDGLEWIIRETTSHDVAIVFFAGHGINDPNGTYYFLPHDFHSDKLKRTGIPFFEIKQALASLAGKTLFFVDTCHAGNIMGVRRAASRDITAVINELASAENGTVVFASSSGNQYSLEDDAWGNGAFTKAVVEGLDGKADYTGKGKITVNMLDLYISERVKELTGGKQTPTTTKPYVIPDFPIAMSQH